MVLFNGALSITGVTFLMFCLLGIAAVGYAVGRITIKGVALETAGVFLAALVFGCLFYDTMLAQFPANPETGVSALDSLLSIIETLGLVLFVTSVGFIAGPRFFGNMKKNFKSYVLLGAIIILAGGLTAAACILIARATGLFADFDQLTAVIVGLLSGALTSTPAFTAAKEAVGGELEAMVSAGYGIAYIFGVIGVVLFVQLMPKFVKADMAEERQKLVLVSTGETKRDTAGLIDIDGFGFMPFMLAALVGIVVGKFAIGSFSLTTTGGCLFVALIFGHFGKIGKISIMPKEQTLKVFRELGLMLFLTGAGISGGAEFIAIFNPLYFLFGVVMTLLPMIVGYFFAKYVLKLSLLNNLGSLTGGMTSTPALGTLISVSGTENVAAAYAATYPIALIAVVLVSQILIIVF